jgi:hypothetical protein
MTSFVFFFLIIGLSYKFPQEVHTIQQHFEMHDFDYVMKTGFNKKKFLSKKWVY